MGPIILPTVVMLTKLIDQTDDFVVCWASVASGAIAAALSNVMNARRFI
jgi:hypothetical protein